MPRLWSSRVMLGLLSLVVGIVSLAPTAAQDTEPKILRVRWSGEWIADLEPQTNEHGIADLTLLNYEGLTRLDEELNVVPGAAESWEFSDDGLTLTFRLRENLTYSDGSPLTAERFRYAIERLCSPQLGSWDAEGLFDIDGCEALNQSVGGAASTPVASADDDGARASLGVRALDDRTLEIRLRQRAPYFLALTSGLGFIPVKQELIEAGGPDWWRDPASWVGNGPFQLATIEPDASPPRISLLPNERYWGGRPKLDGIEYVIMDGYESVDAYVRGELDIISPHYDDLPAIEADPVLSREVLKLPAPFVGMFNFNLQREPFADKLVREAFAYGFDRDAYCREIERDACTGTLSWIPPEVPGSIESDAYAFDPGRAREALGASTYGGPENLPEIIYYVEESDDPWYQEQAEWIANQYRQVLDVEMVLMTATDEELDAMFDGPAGWPQFTGTFWYSDLPDPHEWMRYWTCGSEFFAVHVGYCNPEYDALVEAADTEMDPLERVMLVEESQRLLIADAPAVIGYTWDTIVLVKPYVTGYSPTALNQSWPGWATPLTVDIDRSAI